MAERAVIVDGVARHQRATTRPPPANTEPRDETVRPRIAAALCVCCGEPAGRRGCLIALAWVGALHAFRWVHRACGTQAGMITRHATTTVLRLKVPRCKRH